MAPRRRGGGRSRRWWFWGSRRRRSESPTTATASASTGNGRRGASPLPSASRQAASSPAPAASPAPPQPLPAPAPPTAAATTTTAAPAAPAAAEELVVFRDDVVALPHHVNEERTWILVQLPLPRLRGGGRGGIIAYWAAEARSQFGERWRHQRRHWWWHRWRHRRGTRRCRGRSTPATVQSRYHHPPPSPRGDTGDAAGGKVAQGPPRQGGLDQLVVVAGGDTHRGEGR